MTDLISRRAAIDAVAKALKGTFVEYEDIAEKIINKVPSAEPKSYRMGYQAGYKAAQRWNPCSKGLPKKYGSYYVTTNNGETARSLYIKGLLDDYWNRCVTAWMPLPEPYRERR